MFVSQKVCNPILCCAFTHAVWMVYIYHYIPLNWLQLISSVRTFSKNWVCQCMSYLYYVNICAGMSLCRVAEVPTSMALIWGRHEVCSQALGIVGKHGLSWLQDVEHDGRNTWRVMIACECLSSACQTLDLVSCLLIQNLVEDLSLAAHWLVPQVLQ